MIDTLSRFRVGCPRLLTWAVVTGLAILIFGAAMDGDFASAGTAGTNRMSNLNGQVRLTGVVVPGTVHANGTGTSFTLQDHGNPIPVISDKPLALTTGRDQQVVVEGEMRPDGVWVADQVIDQHENVHRLRPGR